MRKTVCVLVMFLTLSITIFAQNFVEPSGTLPVELIYFTGEVVDTTVELKWGTATEINNYGYSLLRADTSFTWATVDFIDGYGNSNSPKDYLYIDTTITKNGDYFYLLEQIDVDGVSEMHTDTVKVTVSFITSLEQKAQVDNLHPEECRLLQNYPNPFNPETNITFEVQKSSNIKLEVYSITGEIIKTLYNGYVMAGTHIVKFNANHLSSGSYIYKLSNRNNSITKKMLFIK